MRLYGFCCRYVSGIQSGIQFAHAVDQLWLKYSTPSHQKSAANRCAGLLTEFSRYHKTFILLNGGDNNALIQLIEFLNNNDNPHPWQFCREPGLNDAITCVVILLPEKFYSESAMKTAERLRGYGRPALDVEADFDPDYSAWELELLLRKSQCHLAH